MVWEILNTKKVREKSGNFIIWAKNIWVVAGILSILSVENVDFFLACFSRSILLKVHNDLLEFFTQELFIFLNCRIGELHKDNFLFIGCKKRKRL